MRMIAGVALAVLSAGAVEVDGARTQGAEAWRQAIERAAEATSVSTDHLVVDVWATEDELAPGETTTLVVDVRPKAAMHVYAPGADADGYRVVALTLVSAPWIDSAAIEFPPSEVYYFEPLDERVPVYSAPFRLAQDVTLSASDEARAALAGHDTLVIEATLDYQACDDKLCYRPVSLPVSWSFALDR